MNTNLVKIKIIQIFKYLYSILFVFKSSKNITNPLNDINVTYSNDVKTEINKFIDENYKPSHFLTLQLPENLKTTNFIFAKDCLKNIMKSFEKSLMNNWNRHHLPFIAFAELGLSRNWHFHLLLNQENFTDEQLKNAILKANKREKLPSYCLKLEKIDNAKQVEGYCTKEIKIKEYNKFDSDRIIFSHDLFNLPYKNK